MLMLNMYIFYRAKKLKKEVPKNYKEILEQRTNLPQLNKNKFKFSFWQGALSSLPSASVTIFGGIMCSPEWAARLVLFNDEATINAFTMTIGHELTHKGKELNKKCLSKNDKRFKSWVTEVHADFGGAEKMVDCDRHKLVESMRYKLKQKRKDKYHESHPSWALRKCYAEYCDFNEKLIRRIAEDTCCHNEDLIDEAINFYDDILLHPQPITTT